MFSNRFQKASSFFRRNTSEKGFTLVELMVTAILLGMMTIITFRMFSGVIGTLNVSRDRLRIFQQMRVTLDQMQREIASATPIYDPNASTGTGVNTASGIIGNYEFVGQTTGAAPIKLLSFNAFRSNTKENLVAWEVTELKYFLDVQTTWQNINTGTLIYRIISTDAPRPDGNVVTGGTKAPLGIGLTGLTFSYSNSRTTPVSNGAFSSNTWNTNTNSSHSLPYRVLVTLSQLDTRGGEIKLSRVIFIPDSLAPSGAAFMP